ncbi:hypothetical protein ACE1OC_18795 [Streptomyces sp. DSM 116496]|uniref:hypothetical protein n=1 Tax=Streptomyces stoeckheimensis TaxID=3344656 RepID=UPI0038B2DF8C
MGIFSRKDREDDVNADLDAYEEAKRQAGEFSQALHGRIVDGTATCKDLKIWNAGRRRR